MTRDTVYPTLKTITIDDTENYSRLNHTTLFKTVKHLLDNGIKPAMKVRFTPLQNTFTQKMQKVMDHRMQVLSNIQAEKMDRTINQMTQDNALLRTLVDNLTKGVRSNVAGKALPTWPPLVTATPLLLILVHESAAAAADRQTLIQQATGRPHCGPCAQFCHRALTHHPPRPRHSHILLQMQA